MPIKSAAAASPANGPTLRKRCSGTPASAPGQEGTATIEFGLNDAVSSFRVFADAFAADGALGSQSLQIESVEPFYLEPKLPLEVTMDDVIRAPIGVVNATSSPLDGTAIQITAQASQKIESVVPPFAIQPGQRLRQMMRVRVGKFNGRAEFTLSATAGPYRDQVTRLGDGQAAGLPDRRRRAAACSVPATRCRTSSTIPEDLVRRQPGGADRRLSHAAGQHDRSPGAADSRAVRLLRADQFDHLSAGHGPAVLPVAPRRRSVAGRTQRRDSDQGLRAAVGLRVHRAAASSGSAAIPATTR